MSSLVTGSKKVYFDALEMVSQQALLNQKDYHNFDDFLCRHIFYTAKESRPSLLKRFLALAIDVGKGRKEIHDLLHFKLRTTGTVKVDMVRTLEHGPVRHLKGRGALFLETTPEKTALRWAVEAMNR